MATGGDISLAYGADKRAWSNTTAYSLRQAGVWVRLAALSSGQQDNPEVAMAPRKIFSRMTDSSDDTLGGRLSAARDASGFTLADVANRVGVRRDSLLAWEADRAEPRPSKLIDLAGILGVSPMWLMTGHGAGPLQDSDEMPLEALRLQLQRLTDAHQECGRLIAQIAREIDRCEEKSRRESVGRDLDGPMMGRA